MGSKYKILFSIRISVKSVQGFWL